MKKIIAAVMVFCMVLALAVPGLADDVKYTVEEMNDGWIRVTQDGGDTLGYSPDTGVALLDDGGFAFKDLNQNGELDAYEDWRLSNEERAAAAVELMSLEDMAGLRIDALTMSVDASKDTSLTLGEGEANTLENYIAANGLRYADSMSFSMNGSLDNAANNVKYANKLQALAEGSGLGLPFIIACDPSSALMGNTSQQIQAATFDPDSINALWQQASKGYRAMGVSMMLGPQVDLETDPRALTATVFTEDPRLAADMTNAAINGMQSTYDEDGNDLGWGTDSVICQMKHYAANNAIEGGRSYHYDNGKYSVYPGGAFETQLIPYVDGGFSLTGETKQTGAIMLTYSIPWDDDGSHGENKAGALNSFLIDTAASYGFEGLVATDAIGVSQYDYDGSYEGATAAEMAANMFMAGVDQILSSNFSFEDVLGAYDIMAEELGEEEALENFRKAAYDAVIGMFRLELVENPYLVVADSVSFLKNYELAQSDITDVTQSSIVMVKNATGAIAEKTGDEKPTVYIPLAYKETTTISVSNGSFSMTTTGDWVFPCSEVLANRYFNVVTDTKEEASDEASGEPSVIRASAEELADCDMALLIITNPDTGSGYESGSSGEPGEYVPISLQYSEYTADSDAVRQKSIAGDAQIVYTESPYGIIESRENENRSYYGNSVTASNVSNMELVQEVAEKMPEDADVVICMNTAGALVFSEIEPYADSILMLFGRQLMGGMDMAVFTDPSVDNFLAIVAGEVEPGGLLPLQMPADMETVEAQCEDVPRDMECYVDAEGNTYDFAFGMNWSGVIDDERVATYSVPTMTVPETPKTN